MPKNIFKQVVLFFQSVPASLALILLSQTILRIPNFFEPYWYGDEAIYLTIGNALNRGSLMYTDIVDHKTPLIYYLARVGSQLNFRILLFVWMIITTTAFFYLAKKLLKNNWAVIFATTLFVIFTTIPRLEGNIPNGELFVMGFILVGLWLMSKTNYFKSLLDKKYFLEDQITKSELGVLLGAGFFGGLALLTKVPALFDVLAIFSIGYFSVVNYLFLEKVTTKNIFFFLKKILFQWGLLLVGVLTPILISVAYYFLKGSGQDYLQFGLLYNFKYAGSWQLELANPVLSFFFTLPGKLVFILASVAVLTLIKRFFNARFQFIFCWFVLALVASLLSNRPYPHYFLQVIPPLALIFGLLTSEIVACIKNKKVTTVTIASVGSSTVAVGIFFLVLVIMKVGYYATFSYYKNFISLLTGSLNQHEYNQTFNPLMSENYEVGTLIMSESPDKIFIWGTNPALYALTKTRPVGRFTVSFHIEDLHVQDETIDQLRTEKPLYIVVMRDQVSPLPGLDSFLKSNYRPIKSTEHMVVWRKSNTFSRHF